MTAEQLTEWAMVKFIRKPVNNPLLPIVLESTVTGTIDMTGPHPAWPK
jgi:hypothetical protein